MSNNHAYILPDCYICLKGTPCDAQDDKEKEKGEGSEDETEEDKISKRKRKLESRLKIAELKQTCPRPEVVEVWDVTAQDPRLLVYLKVRHITALHCFSLLSCSSESIGP